MNMIATITSVDMDGFCGRENHPGPHMVGQRVLVHGIETINMEPLLDDGEDYTETVLYATLTDGTPVDLMAFEVRIERVEHDGRVLTPSVMTLLRGK